MGESSILIELEFGNVGFSGGRKTTELREKPSEQGENQQQTHPHMAPGWNRTRATLVRGKHSHHCATNSHHSITKVYFQLSSQAVTEIEESG